MMNMKLLEIRKREDILRINYTAIHQEGPRSGFLVVFLAFSVKMFANWGVPWTAGAEPPKIIRREGLYGTSQPALVLKEIHLDQNTIVNVKPQKEKAASVTTVTRHAFFVVLWYRHRFPVKASGAGGYAGTRVCNLEGSTSYPNQHR